MRAVVEHHGADNVDLPRIEVVIGKGKEDLTIQVCMRTNMMNARPCFELVAISWFRVQPMARSHCGKSILVRVKKSSLVV